jgi:hypothetical protein
MLVSLGHTSAVSYLPRRAVYDSVRRKSYPPLGSGRLRAGLFLHQVDSIYSISTGRNCVSRADPIVE